MMKKTLRICFLFAATIVICFAVAGSAFAATSMPGLITYQQPDGTQIQYYLKGDENGSWRETRDGSLILQDSQSGYYYYANRVFSHVYRSNAKVGIDGKPIFGTTGQDSGLLLSQSASVPGSVLIQSGNSSTALTGSVSVPTTQPVLVLIINFANVSSTAATGYWQDTFFINTKSSVSGYFDEVSYGATSIVPAPETGQTENDGVISITLPQNHPATDGFTEDIMLQIPGVVRQALEQADAYVDFATFDKNDDSVVGTDELHIAAIFAGGEATTGGIYNSIWAHSWDFEPMTLDGTAVSNYIAAGEKFADSKGYPGTTNMTCGVFCHELGHSMGLPDLYDYGYDSEGLGGLSLMGSGSWGPPYGTPGKYPVHMDAWSKIALGFVTPIEAVEGTEYIVNETTQSTYNVLKINSPDDPDQYFLVENRMMKGYDYGLTGFFANRGIVIYHIDEEVMRYSASHPDTFASFNDNRFRKGIDVEEANQAMIHIPELDYCGTNRSGFINPLPQQWRGHTFFAADDSTRYTNYFSDTTIPSAKLYSNPVDESIVPPLVYDAQTDQQWYFESDATIGVQNDPSGVTIEVMDMPLDAMRVRYNIPSYSVVLTSSPSTGGVVSGSGRYEENADITLQATPGAGYTFGGWWENDSLFDEDNPLPLIATRDLNLSALFLPISYTARFDGNGGMGQMDSMDMVYDVPQKLPANVFVRTGYEFDGWSLTPDGAKIAWDQSSVSKLTTIDGATVTLYARWKLNRYWVTYNLNGGVNDVLNPATYSYINGDILLRPAVRTGYQFLGWYAESDFSGLPIVKIPAASLGDVVLYAKWEGNTYSIRFDGNGGSGTMIDQMMVYDTTTKLAAQQYKMTGYHFLGWATSATGPAVYANMAAVKNLTLMQHGMVKLYAKWGINTYEVSFNHNGATSGVMYRQSITYNTPTTLSVNGYTKTGYRFLGWAKDPTGSVLYNNSATVLNLTTENEGVVILYARWGAPIASASSIGYNSIKISWAAAGDATSYKIYRATSSSGAYTLVHTAGSTVRSYVNTGLVTGKTYFYKIYPVADGKTFAHSAYKYAKPVPATPTITLSKVGITGIKVGWTGVSGASGYQIYRATSASGTYTLIHTSASTTRAWTDAGVTAGKTYYYKVRAYHLEGTAKIYGSFTPVEFMKR